MVKAERKRILLQLLMVLSVAILSVKAEDSTDFVGTKIEVAGTLKGRDKAQDFADCKGRIEIVSEENDWFGKGVYVRFFKGDKSTHENGYGFYMDSKQRNRWGFRQSDGRQTFILANVNLISETDVTLSLDSDGILTITYEMWNDEDDAPFVDYRFYGRCENWDSIREMLNRALPYVAEPLVDPN